MKLLTLLLAALLAATFLQAQPAADRYREDFAYFCRTIAENYCYWDKKKTNWDSARVDYARDLDTISSDRSFLMLLERMFHELYDHHASMNANTSESSKLVPSGTDIWSEYKNGIPVIIEVRPGSGAEKAGIREGMWVIAINGVPVDEAMRRFLPRSLSGPDLEASNYALRVALAGTHHLERKLQLAHNGKTSDYFPDAYPRAENKPALEIKRFGNIGYIRINDHLWNNELIGLFDSAMDQLRSSAALILDLRETPSGGNTTVARAMMGRFIQNPGYYQLHELTAEERETGIKRSWAEIVSPRGETYKKPLVVLVGHWTGSMGEGIAIGFDALKRATLIGTEMARLNGAIYSYRLPNTGFGFSFPVEKLFHVNGKPRESFTPGLRVNPVAGRDLVLETALKRLAKYR